MTLRKAILRTAFRLAADRSGLALLEFALTLPMVLMLGLAGTELAHIAFVTERITQIALLTADNAARVRDTIDETDVNQIMTGAKYVGQSINLGTHGRIILSDIQNNPTNTGQWIRWQRCTGAKNVSSSYGTVDDGKLNTSLSAGVGPSGNKVSASAGTIVMLVEIVYDYQPIVPIDYFGPRTIRSVQSFNVRQRNPSPSANANGTVMNPMPSDVTNTTALTGTARSLCAYFSA